MSAQRANMTWPERQEQIDMQKLVLLKSIDSRLTIITQLLGELNAKAEGKVADKSNPKSSATPSVRTNSPPGGDRTQS